MAGDDALPGRQELEDEVRRLLERARRRTGESVAAMVDLLGPLQARTAGTRRSWYDWQERPETVSALTVLAALHLLGPAGTVEAVFGAEAAGGEQPELERQLNDVRRELAEQRRRNEAVEARLEELASMLRTSSAPAPETIFMSAPVEGDAEGLLSQLETAVAQLGDQLDRPWREGISYADLEVSPTERLNRRVGTLQARLAEVAAMVNAPYGGYRPAPGESASADEHRRWLVEILGVMRQQVEAVRERASRFRAGGRRQPQAGDNAG